MQNSVMGDKADLSCDGKKVSAKGFQCEKERYYFEWRTTVCKKKACILFGKQIFKYLRSFFDDCR